MMGKPGGKKKKNAGVGIDFARAKHKVGKALPKTSNYTDTTVRAKRIKLTQQSVAQGASASLPTTSRDQPLQVLLQQVGHYSPKVRQEAVEGIAEIATKAAWHVQQQAGAVLEALLSLLPDESQKVRTALHTAFARTLQHVLGPQHVAPYLPAAVAQLLSGMTHAAPSVRATSAQVLNSFAAMCGSLLLRHHMPTCARMLAGTLSRQKRGQSVKASSIAYLAASLARARLFLDRCVEASDQLPAEAHRPQADPSLGGERSQGGEDSTPTDTGDVQRQGDAAARCPPRSGNRLTRARGAAKFLVTEACGRLETEAPAVTCIAPYHPGVALLHLRAFAHVPGAVREGPDVNLRLEGDVTVGPDVTGVLDLVASLAGCWEDAAAEAKVRAGQEEGAVWDSLRDAAHCMLACMKLLGSQGSEAWRIPPHPAASGRRLPGPHQPSLALHVIRATRAVWPLGHPSWLASPQVLTSMADTDLAAAQLLAHLVSVLPPRHLSPEDDVTNHVVQHVLESTRTRGAAKPGLPMGQAAEGAWGATGGEDTVGHGGEDHVGSQRRIEVGPSAAEVSQLPRDRAGDADCAVQQLPCQYPPVGFQQQASSSQEPATSAQLPSPSGSLPVGQGAASAPVDGWLAPPDPVPAPTQLLRDNRRGSAAAAWLPPLPSGVVYMPGNLHGNCPSLLVHSDLAGPNGRMTWHQKVMGKRYGTQDQGQQDRARVEGGAGTLQCAEAGVGDGGLDPRGGSPSQLLLDPHVGLNARGEDQSAADTRGDDALVGDARGVDAGGMDTREVGARGQGARGEGSGRKGKRRVARAEPRGRGRKRDREDDGGDAVGKRRRAERGGDVEGGGDAQLRQAAAKLEAARKLQREEVQEVRHALSTFYQAMLEGMLHTCQNATSVEPFAKLPAIYTALGPLVSTCDVSTLRQLLNTSAGLFRAAIGGKEASSARVDTWRASLDFLNHVLRHQRTPSVALPGSRVASPTWPWPAVEPALLATCVLDLPQAIHQRGAGDPDFVEASLQLLRDFLIAAPLRSDALETARLLQVRLLPLLCVVLPPRKRAGKAGGAELAGPVLRPPTPAFGTQVYDKNVPFTQPQVHSEPPREILGANPGEPPYQTSENVPLTPTPYLEAEEFIGPRPMRDTEAHGRGHLPQENQRTAPREYSGNASSSHVPANSLRGHQPIGSTPPSQQGAAHVSQLHGPSTACLPSASEGQEASGKLPFPRGKLRLGVAASLAPAQQCALLDLVPHLPHVGPTWRAPLTCLLMTDVLPMHVALRLAEVLAAAHGNVDPVVTEAVRGDIEGRGIVLGGISNVLGSCTDRAGEVAGGVRQEGIGNRMGKSTPDADGGSNEPAIHSGKQQGHTRSVVDGEVGQVKPSEPGKGGQDGRKEGAVHVRLRSKEDIDVLLRAVQRCLGRP